MIWWWRWCCSGRVWPPVTFRLIPLGKVWPFLWQCHLSCYLTQHIMRRCLGWYNSSQARLANLHEWIRVSQGVPFIRPCPSSKQKSLVNHHCTLCIISTCTLLHICLCRYVRPHVGAFCRCIPQCTPSKRQRKKKRRLRVWKIELAHGWECMYHFSNFFQLY